MAGTVILVKDCASLQEAVQQEAVHIEVAGRITDLPSLTLYDRLLAVTTDGGWEEWIL